MLLNFEFSNYKSFHERQSFTMEAVNSYKELKSNVMHSEIPGITNKSWLKGAVIYGANASGKTSVIEAMGVLRYLVTDSASFTDPETPIPAVFPFAFAPVSEPSVFRVEIAIKNIKHEFTLAVTQERVIYESLKVFPNKNGASQTRYERKWNANSSEYEWSGSKSSQATLDKTRRKLTLKNMLYLSRSVSLGDELLEPVFRWFKDHLILIDQAEKRLSEEFTSDWIQNDHNRKLITQLLKSADLGITNIRVKKQFLSSEVEDEIRDRYSSTDAEKMINELKQQKRIELEHQGPDGEAIYLPWKHESLGTQKLFAMLGPWIDMLNSGRVVFVDELESSFHPNIVRELLKLFMFNDFSSAQLVFTSHCSILLDEEILRRDQIWFTEKNTDGKSTLYPLTKFKPRNDESLARGYLAGRYGGTPFIPSELFKQISKNQPANISE
ncbi:MAG: AAA family ATPase [Akkermansiaceae bacterium]